MLFSAVVVISCFVSSVHSLVDIEDNVILTDDSLEDLLKRTKKSPDIIFGQRKSWNKDDKKTNLWNGSKPVEESESQQKSGPSDSEVSAEITAVLVKDIKKKLNNLEKLENSYKMLKSDSSNRQNIDSNIKPETDESINSKVKSFLESKLSEDKILDGEESVRLAREYDQGPQHCQTFYEKGKMSTDNAYSDNGRYLGLSDSNKNMYGDRGDPYLAQFNPSARTYEAAGIEGYAQGGEHEKTEHQSPLRPLKQLKQIIPNVINTIAQITAPIRPTQNTVPVKKPEYGVHRPTSGLHLQEQHGVHRPTSGLHLQGQHGQNLKGLSTTPIFFSKQLIFGIGTDKNLDTKHYGNTITGGHSYPAYSYYPSAYSYYSPASYWGPLRDDYSPELNPYPETNPYYPSFYSLSPDAQNIYDPTLPPYSQGNAYNEPPNSEVQTSPADSNFKTVSDAYRSHEVIPLYKNDESIKQEDSQSQYLKSSPHKLQNLTLDEIESAIKNEKEKIEKIKENIDGVEWTASNKEKNTQLSNNVKLNSTISRRSADNEDSVGSSKASKLCFKGKVDENTGVFNFVEMEC